MLLVIIGGAVIVWSQRYHGYIVSLHLTSWIFNYLVFYFILKGVGELVLIRKIVRAWERGWEVNYKTLWLLREKSPHPWRSSGSWGEFSVCVIICSMIPGWRGRRNLRKACVLIMSMVLRRNKESGNYR